nr:hypothetical protein [Desulfuromonas thiophila]
MKSSAIFTTISGKGPPLRRSFSMFDIEEWEIPKESAKSAALIPSSFRLFWIFFPSDIFLPPIFMIYEDSNSLKLEGQGKIFTFSA